MSETRPRTEQIRFNSDLTGEHLLDEYIEACERPGMTLADLISVLFDSSGDIHAGFFAFRIKDLGADDYTLQFRVGPYVDPDAGWVDISDDVFTQILTAAKNYRDQASSSALTATTQAGIATNQASNASTSAGNALISENNAAASALAAAASAAEGLYNDIVTLTSADSPYIPSAAQEGTLFKLDTSSGPIVINLSNLSVYGEDMKFAFVKSVVSANNATVNGQGGFTISLFKEFETHVAIGDHSTNIWLDIVQSTGIPDGSVTNAKLASMVQATIKGRNAGAGTGAPQDLTATQATAILDAMVGDSGSGGTKGLVPAPSAGDAAAGKVLAADGTWKAASGFGGVKRTLITSTSTFTPDPAAKATFVHGIGGGGNGGGSNTGGALGGNASGGGSGRYGWVWITSPIVGTVSVTINGVAGSSVFGAYLTCAAGSNGSRTSGDSMVFGGLGGHRGGNAFITSSGLGGWPGEGNGGTGAGSGSGFGTMGGGAGYPGWGTGGNSAAAGTGNAGSAGTGYGAGGGGSTAGVGGSGTGGAFEVIEFLG